MRMIIVCPASCIVAALTAHAGAAITDFNGFKFELRNFNDYPSSLITTTSNGTTDARLVEVMNPPLTGDPQKFANRHFAMLSADGGATRLSLRNNQPFRVSYNMRLISNIDVDGSGQLWNQQPEGGLFFGNDRGGGFIDEGGIIVVGNGTVFVGGANQRFSFIGDRNNGTQVFEKGELLYMSYSYYPPGIKGPEAAYRVVFENVTTGFRKEVSNTFDTGGPDANGFNNGSWVGLRFQNTRNPLALPSTTHDTNYTNVQVASCSADLNGDDVVDDNDFVIFAGAYNDLLCPTSPSPCNADLNNDTLVDDSDFVIFAGQYNDLLCP
ncbi:MAG TPA: hypothetical protein VF777_13380 [Phycisphaerales bacterium]